MNDPLYNHPVWQNQTIREEEEEEEERGTRREGEEEERYSQRTIKPEDMENIVSKIIKSKFAVSASCGPEGGSSDSAATSVVEEKGGRRGEEVGEVGDEEGAEREEKVVDTSMIQEKDACMSVMSNDVNVCTSSPSLIGLPTVLDPDCTECRSPCDDPLPTDLVMYLHAITYKVHIHVYM